MAAKEGKTPQEMAEEIHALRASGLDDETIKVEHADLGPGWPYLDVVAVATVAAGAGPTRLTVGVVPI